VYKRRYLVVSVFVLVVGGVAAKTFTTVPVYEASTRLLIEAENPNVVSFQEVINEQEARADYNQTQYNILQSRSLARRTIDTLNLWEHPRFGGAPDEDAAEPSGMFAWVDGSIEWVKATVGLSDDGEDVADNAIPGADETAQQSGVIDSFLGGLSVSPLRNSRLVDVMYRSPDPALATRIVNAVASGYIAQNLEYKFLASKEATDWLGERLAEQRDQVQRAELALQRYREQNDAISFTDRENIVVQKLTDLNAAVTRAKTTRIEKESVYNQLQISRNDPTVLDTFPAILTNSFIQGLKTELADLQRQRTTLRETFLDSHPRMIDVNSAIQTTQTKLDAEIQKVVLSVKSEFDSAAAQERSLMQALDQQKNEALGMNEKFIEYSVLDREAQSSKQLYDSLMQRAKETGVSGELRTSNIRVVDPAEQPRSPVLPNTRLNLMGGVAGGAFLAVMLALGFDYLDSRIKTPEEIETYLGLPHLGMLPLMNKVATGGKYVRLDGAPPANFSEAFRTVRTNVLFSSATEGGQTLIVTSTGPGEGKSLVASNLAISLALAGRRTLLIDADMRKPKVQDVFSVDAEPGLSNLLVGEAKASECVRKSSTNELWVLPAGRIPPNPAELLGSKRCLAFMESLKGHFEWIIIDTPPVLAVADVSVLAHAVNGTLFVVGSEMTSRHAARQAVHQLTNVQARVLGVVLNRVDLERNAYYYSQYYRREYTSYYVKQGG
jgi:capsular exopolysaccharide synthesis family protein